MEDDSYFGNSAYKRYNSDSEYVSRSEGDDDDYYQEDLSSESSIKSESELYISYSNKKGKKWNKKDNFDKKHFIHKKNTIKKENAKKKKEKAKDKKQ